ncbi:unnamed protein product [Schistosoma rodhaini]|uniref:Pecanex-like protein n=1 Tax=Schistosoma rodhaini TaxID=6188 RepID=A0AA85FGU6_9TREM|nr:unnamed protein product [Schistosoma rodhaini]
MRLRMIPVIFKEGIIASLTGGFYFDSSQTHFANIIHVYVWIILFVIPLILYMISVKSHITALLYGFSIGSFVLIVKLVIWRLHDLLDKSDPVDNSQKANKAYSKKQLSTRHQTGVHEDDQEHFQDINDIENKCRRIGVAGIELADLRDSTFNHVCHFTDSEITVGSAIQNTHILNDKGICKYEPLENNLGSDLAFSDSFTDSITFPVSSFQLGPSASRLNYVTIEQSSSCSNGDSLVPDLCAVEEEKQSTENKLNPSNSNCALSSNNSNQICKSETITSGLLKSTTSSTSAETKNTDFAQNLNARTVKPIYVNTLIKSFSGRNGRRAPVRRQFSETAVKNAFEVQRLVTFYDQTDRVSGSQFDHFVPEITGPITGELSVDKSSRPSTSIPNRSLVRSSSVRTEIEQCKRILNQLKRDVSQLPLLPIARFTPSMKDLDTLDLNPKVLQAAPLSYVRSRSQLRRRALFIDRDQNKRTITYLTASGRNSIPYSTELSLSETIFFWRQCFANINFDRPVRRRHQQADIIAFNEIPLSNLNLRPRRLPRGWRSHSLRYDLAAMKPFTPHPRQLVRRPGTSVCLQRQESAGSTSSAVVKSSPLQFSTPERKTIKFSVSDSHDSTGSDIVEAITLDSQQVQNDPDNIPVDASKWPVSSSNPLDEVQPSTQSHDSNEKVDEYVEKKVKDIEITSLSNHLSDDGFTVNLQTPITHPLDESSSNKIANDHYNVESNKSLLTKTRGSNRLTRQAGFRRRPAMSSGSYSQSKGITSLKNEKATSSRDNHLHTEVTKKIKRSDVDSTLQTSSSVSKPISTNPISVDQAVDDLLAHLMGVKSLADTGLTRQQCLFQLRGNGNTEDSENAEWDILYAVTEAATDNSTVKPEPAETITTNINAITTTATTSQTDGQPAQFRTTNSESKNRDDIYQDDTFNNLDEDSWDLQEISIKACPSTNDNQEVDDEINTQEAVANRSNDSGSDDNGGNNSSSNSLLWFFRKGFRPSKLQQQQQQQHHPLSTAPIHTISLSSCFPFTFRFQLNRLELGYIFDKSFTTMEIILCSILAALVSIIGYYTLRTASFQDYGPLACFTIAGCHYSLMKSVQPDPASPKHGFNRLIVFTRSFFFCSFASIYLLANYLYQPQKSVPFSGVMSSMEHIGELRFESITTIYQSTRQMLPLDISETSNELTAEKINWRMPNFYHLSQSSKMIVEPASPSTFKFYGVHLSVDRLTYIIKYSSIYVLLIFPILFCLGLMPQINTVLIYALEQLDIHVFGASGTTGLFSVILSIFRTFIVIGLTFVPCYYSVQKSDPQCMLFSIFWGIQIALCFLLSRLPSNAILYEALFPSERRMYYWYRIRMFFYNAWRKITVKCNLIFQSKEKRKKKKTHRSQLTSIDNSNWWKRLPLLFPNLRMKSTNASFKKTDENVEEFLLTRLTHTKGCVDVESGVPVQSHSLPCRLISRDSLTQSASTPAIKYNLSHFESPSTIVVPSSWIESQDVNNSENKKFSTLDKINNNTNNNDNNNNSDNNNRTNTLPSFVIDQNLSASVNTLTISKDNSRVTTEQYQTTDSKITQSQFENNDPLPNLIRISLLARFENDLLSCILWFILAFLSHLTITIITTTNTTINSTDFHSYYYCYILNWISVVLGFLLHYVWPNFRKPYPWLLLVKPVVEPDLHGRIIRWEVAYFWLCWLERNLFLPAITMCTVTQSFDSMAVKFGPLLSTFIIIVCSMKMLRNGFCCAKQTYLSLFFTNLLFSFDFYNFKEAFPINYFFVSLLVSKFIELFRKLHFIYVYLAPFNIIWGSVAHAIVQLGSIPHSVFLFANCIFSTILSAPLEPFMASAIFITSYVRPICFWETNHRTQRIETTNMPIAAQLKGISKHQVSGNLDGIFYEHLTRKLQRTLAGDLQLGRIGGLTVQHGDVFILSTDDLNLLIHIIEVGNGFVTYQLRGLEFIGTLCHASESEALRSDPHKSKRFCCCHSKTIHGLLSFNTAVRLRCMTWQFAYTPYIVEGYEVTDHSAGLTFQLTDLRKVLISRFVHCIIYYVCKLPNLSNRLTQLTPCLDSNRFLSPDYFDLDPVFFKAIDDDFDEDVSGVTKQRFIQIYSDWIAYCLKKQIGNSSVPCGPDSPVVSLCLALSLLGRRCMGGQQSSKPILDQFLHGVHQVFAGDINLVPRDDWVLVDLDLLQTVVTPSVRIALKLYQDTFTWSSGNTHSELYKKIVYTEKNVVICPETDPKWRFAVLNDADCLFSFRWVSGRTSMDVYRIVQLTKRRLEFRAIKLNPECVRGLWAGQQREQIFLRNNNEERGSIQSANPVLRNLVNSSCDPPIGYPIYVSPLITSFAGDNDDYINVSGGELSFVSILLRICDCWRRFRQLCGCKKEKCDGQIESTTNPSLFTRCNTSQQLKTNVSSTTYNKSSTQLALSTYPSTSNDNDNLGKWSSKQVDCNEETTLIALIHQQNDLDNITGGILSATTNKFRENCHFDHICCSIDQLYKNRQQVIIVDTCQILNGHLNKLQWPFKGWYLRSLTYSACRSSVYSGLGAYRIHRWTPNNPDPNSRSFCHRTIALLAFPEGPPLLDGYYVAIWEDKGLIEVKDSDKDINTTITTTTNNDNDNNNNNSDNNNSHDQFLMNCLFTNRN